MYWEHFLSCRDAKTDGGLNIKWVFGIEVTNTITAYNVSGTGHAFILSLGLIILNLSIRLFVAPLQFSFGHLKILQCEM